MDQVFYKLNHSIGLSLLYKTIYNSSKSISNFIMNLFYLATNTSMHISLLIPKLKPKNKIQRDIKEKKDSEKVVTM